MIENINKIRVKLNLMKKKEVKKFKHDLKGTKHTQNYNQIYFSNFKIAMYFNLVIEQETIIITSNISEAILIS